MRNTPLFDTDEALSGACHATTKALRDGLDWVQTSENEAVRANGARLIKDLRKAVVKGGKLELAAKRKMCVGVFGASQAGKSYLISALARKGQNRLIARFGEERVDFITCINPEGGIESTGLVTRFTIQAPAQLPPGHPVSLGLLSEIDVVKVLVNSFAEDVLHPPLEDGETAQEQALYATLDSLRAAVAAAGRAGLAVEEVYDLEDYCTSRLAKTPRLQMLRRCGFWDEAAALAPKLALEDRVRLFSLLWEDLPVFTNLYRRLASALALLGNARNAYCEMAALVEPGSEPGTWVRSPDSIINVSTLAGVGADSGKAVSVTTGHSGAVQIERAELAALVAELNIVMTEQPLPFFSHTDLLDFPGARTRKPQPKDNTLLEAPELRTENLLRGKVAYLFERYCDEQELSSMLLCVGPSNQEVATLPGMIEDWIEATHGKTPQERAKVETALFFVLTKFDTIFERGAGKEAGGTRFDNRLKASLLDAFANTAHRTDWVEEWTPGTPFRNLYWVRNPNLEQRAMFDYDDSAAPLLVETGLRSDMDGFVSTLKAAYLANDRVQRYIAETETAWEAGMALNDGGIGRIAEKLAGICRPEVKRAQVAQRLLALRGEVRDLIGRYYISGDVETLRAEKRALAQDLLRMLGDCFKRQRLGEFHYALRVEDAEALHIFQGAERAAAQFAVQGVGSDVAGETVVTYAKSSDDDIFDLLGVDEASAPVQTKAETAAPKKGQDLAEKFVADLEGVWLDRVADLAKDSHAMAYLGLNGDLVVRLVQELQVTAQRIGVLDHMVEAVRRGQQFKSSKREVWVWRQVAPACALFNDFLATLGLNNAEIIDLRDQKQTVFKPQPEVNALPNLSEELTAYERQYYLDWLQGLQAQVRGNAEFQAGFSGDVEDNARLGRILAALKLSQGAAA